MYLRVIYITSLILPKKKYEFPETNSIRIWRPVPRPRLPQVSHTLPGSSKSVVIRSSVTSSIFCLARFPVHCYPFSRDNNTNDGSEISGNAHSFLLNFFERFKGVFLGKSRKYTSCHEFKYLYCIFLLTKYERFLSCPRQFSSVNLPEATVTLY